MKTKTFLAVVAVISFSFVGTVFAGTTTSFVSGGTETLGTPSVSVKPSKGVTVQYLPETNGAAYSIAASHASGTKIYGSSSGDTKIWMAEVGVSLPAAPATAGASAGFGTGWTAM